LVIYVHAILVCDCSWDIVTLILVIGIGSPEDATSGIRAFQVRGEFVWWSRSFETCLGFHLEVKFLHLSIWIYFLLVICIGSLLIFFRRWLKSIKPQWRSWFTK